MRQIDTIRFSNVLRVILDKYKQKLESINQCSELGIGFSIRGKTIFGLGITCEGLLEQ